jgi:hypothetical protein
MDNQVTQFDLGKDAREGNQLRIALGSPVMRRARKSYVGR